MVIYGETSGKALLTRVPAQFSPLLLPCVNIHEPFSVASSGPLGGRREVRSGAGTGRTGNEANLKKLDKVGQSGGPAQGRAAAFSKMRLSTLGSGGGGEERRLGVPPPTHTHMPGRTVWS